MHSHFGMHAIRSVVVLLVVAVTVPLVHCDERESVEPVMQTIESALSHNDVDTMNSVVLPDVHVKFVGLNYDGTIGLARFMADIHGRGVRSVQLSRVMGFSGMMTQAHLRGQALFNQGSHGYFNYAMDLIKQDNTWRMKELLFSYPLN